MKNEDTIIIHGLEIWTHIGVPDEERAEKQKLEVHLSFPVGNFREAARKDDLTLSVDYFTVSERIKEIASERPRKLIEALAEELADTLRREFHLHEINIEIRKFVLKDCNWVGVNITRP